jgi:GNAT superfamily N-acetyltransferase
MTPGALICGCLEHETPGPLCHGRVSHLSPTARSALAVPPEEFLATVLVLTEDGTVVGHAALRRLDGELEVKRVIVLPEARGKGAASALMSAHERLTNPSGRPPTYPPDRGQTARSRCSVPETWVHTSRLPRPMTPRSHSRAALQSYSTFVEPHGLSFPS